MTSEAIEFVQIYRDASPELKGFIWRLLPLTVRYGMPFLEEMQGRDLEGMKAIISKWEARAAEEAAAKQ